MKQVICLLLVAVTAVGALAQGPQTFLSRRDMPRSTAYLPAPPDTASQAFFNDWQRYNWGKSMRNTPRGQQAVRDASAHIDSIMQGFAPAIGFVVTRDNAPAVRELLLKASGDAYNAIADGKTTYKRRRPFVQFNEPTSVPAQEASHRFTGSYPSGHAVMGWAVALLLVELDPERQEAILDRGYQYGESRVITGYHYQSDVDAARLAASAAVARLHADATFRAALDKARKQYAALVAKRNSNP